MEKYLVVLIIVIICYYVFRYCIQVEVDKLIKTKEGFVDTINKSDPDLVKSITTLGQVAKDLQADGLKIPGNLTVTGTINASSLVVSDRNILAELNTLTTKVDTLTKNLDTLTTNLSKLSGTMRLFSMHITTKLIDSVVTSPDNQTFDGNYVCCVQGVNASWRYDEPHSVRSFCYRDNANSTNLWYVKTDFNNTGDPWIIKPVILVIPISYFSKVDKITN